MRCSTRAISGDWSASATTSSIDRRRAPARPGEARQPCGRRPTRASIAIPLPPAAGGRPTERSPRAGRPRSRACRWSSVPRRPARSASSRSTRPSRAGRPARPRRSDTLAAVPRPCSISSRTRAWQASSSRAREPGSSTSTPRDPRWRGLAGTPPLPVSPIDRSAGSSRTRAGSWPARHGAVGSTTASSWTRRRTATGRVGERGASPTTSSRSCGDRAAAGPRAVVPRLHRACHGAGS